MRLQQMSFMILFVFIFFIVAGLFVLSFNMGSIKASAQQLQKEATLSSLETIADMPEFNCDSSRSLCVDEDKIFILSSESQKYAAFWPVASIKVRKVFPLDPNSQEADIPCPKENCTFYDIYESGQKNVIEYGTYVNLCQKQKSLGVVEDDCSLARLEVGMIISG